MAAVVTKGEKVFLASEIEEVELRRVNLRMGGCRITMTFIAADGSKQSLDVDVSESREVELARLAFGSKMQASLRVSNSK